MADAVRVADADHREHRRAAAEHVDVARRAGRRTRRARAAAPAVPVTRGSWRRPSCAPEVEEVELHHVDAPAAHGARRGRAGSRRRPGSTRRAPTAVPVAQRRAGRGVDDAPVLVLGPEPGRARLDHERREPEPAAQVEPVDLLDQLAEVVAGTARAATTRRTPPASRRRSAAGRSPGRSPNRSRSSSRVLEQPPGADPGRVVVPGLPAERGRPVPARGAATSAASRSVDDERVGAGGDRDRLRDDLLAGARPRPARARRAVLVAPAAVDQVVRRGEPRTRTATAVAGARDPGDERSLVSAWIASAPRAASCSVALQYESVRRRRRPRTPAYDHES